MSESTIQPVIEVQLPAPQISKGEREYHVFLRLLPDLLATHRDKYVAIHNGQVRADLPALRPV